MQNISKAVPNLVFQKLQFDPSILEILGWNWINWEEKLVNLAKIY